MGNNTSTPTTSTGGHGDLSDFQFIKKVIDVNTTGCPNMLHEAQKPQIDHNTEAFFNMLYSACIVASVDKEFKNCAPDLKEIDGNSADVEKVWEKTIDCVEKHFPQVQSVVNRLEKLSNSTQKNLMQDAAAQAESGVNEINTANDSNEQVQAKFQNAANNCSSYSVSGS